MSTIDDLANAIMTMEGANSPSSVNQKMINQYGLYDPGHLIYAGQSGAVPVNIGGTVWAGFSSLDAGVQAIKNQITLDASRGHTLETFINKYAPPSQNDTGGYISNVASWLGLDPSTTLSDIVSGSVSNLASSVSDSTSNVVDQILGNTVGSDSGINLTTIALVGGMVAVLALLFTSSR